MARLPFTSYRRRFKIYKSNFCMTGLMIQKQNLLDASLYFPKQNPGTILHQFIPTDGAYLQHTFLHLISAQKEICIGTPYFIPGKNYDALLKSKRKRGSNHNSCSRKADHPLVRSQISVLPKINTGWLQYLCIFNKVFTPKLL